MQPLRACRELGTVKKEAKLREGGRAIPPLLGQVAHIGTAEQESSRTKSLYTYSDSYRDASSANPALRLLTSFLCDDSCRYWRSCITSVFPGLQGKHRQPDSLATSQAEWLPLQKTMLSASLAFTRPIVPSPHVSRALHRTVASTNIGLASAFSTRYPHPAPLLIDRAASLTVMAAKVLGLVHADISHLSHHEKVF